MVMRGSGSSQESPRFQGQPRSSLSWDLIGSQCSHLRYGYGGSSSTLPSSFASQVRLLTGRGGPMMEVAQPWDLPRPLLWHWRAPQHSRSIPATCPGPSAGTR